MFIECNNIKSMNEVEEYIGDNYYKCLYLYLDLKKYGIDTSFVKTWIQKKSDNITAVILMYYTGMHIFSLKNDYDLEELSEFINNKKPAMICGEKKIIKDVYNFLNEEEYNIETGYVRKLTDLRLNDRTDVKKAEINDFYEIAKLLYEDEDLGSSYELDSLTQQLMDRNMEGYARNYVITENEKVIAHAGTGAENEKVAMLGYVITDPLYRGKGLAKKVCTAVCEDLKKESKDVFLINYSTESTALYDKLGFEQCCEWGKIFLDLKKK